MCNYTLYGVFYKFIIYILHFLMITKIHFVGSQKRGKKKDYIYVIINSQTIKNIIKMTNIESIIVLN